MRRLIGTFMLIFVVTVELCLCQDIVPVRTGNGPTPPPGGRRRKDPTADLPDLSRDELLAILDLIEKSGDNSGTSPVGSPTLAPKRPHAITTPSSYPTETPPTFRPRIPSIPIESDVPEPSGPEAPAPFHTTTTENPAPYTTPSSYPPGPTPRAPLYPSLPTPPNYPAPTAPPPPDYPAPPPPTTPKPKKSFFDKLIRGFMKVIAPPGALNSRSAISSSDAPPNFLGSFLQQLQQTYQNSQREGSGQQRTFAAATQSAILDNLVKRLEGQNSEGSKFVVNLVQTLKSNTDPSSTMSAPVNARTGGQAEQLLGALLKGISSSSGQGSQTGQSGQGGMAGFLETFQKELLRSYNPSAGPTGQKSAGDVLLDGFKQILQNRQ